MLKNTQNDNVHITETTIGNTTYIVRSVCSPNAKETVVQKLKRIMHRHILEAISHQKP